MFFLLRINSMTIVHWKLQLRDHPWWEPHLVTCLTLCTSSKPTKVKMDKMVCIIIKDNLADTEQTQRPNLLVSKNLQLTEIGNCSPVDNQELTEIDHMLFPIYKMIHSSKIINLTEVLETCLMLLNKTSITELQILEICNRLGLNQCCQAWMKWTLLANIRTRWRSRSQEICHILRESLISKCSSRNLIRILMMIIEEIIMPLKPLKWCLLKDMELVNHNTTKEDKCFHYWVHKVTMKVLIKVFSAFQSKINLNCLLRCSNQVLVLTSITLQLLTWLKGNTRTTPYSTHEDDLSSNE